MKGNTISDMAVLRVLHDNDVLEGNGDTQIQHMLGRSPALESTDRLHEAELITLATDRLGKPKRRHWRITRKGIEHLQRNAKTVVRETRQLLNNPRKNFVDAEKERLLELCALVENAPAKASPKGVAFRDHSPGADEDDEEPIDDEFDQEPPRSSAEREAARRGREPRMRAAKAPSVRALSMKTAGAAGQSSSKRPTRRSTEGKEAGSSPPRRVAPAGTPKR